MSLVEEITAVEDTYNIIQEYGQTIQVISQNESIRQYDKFGSPKKVVDSISNEVKAFPIRFSPSEKEIKEAGFSEDVDVIIFISKKELDSKSLTFDILRDRVRLNSKQYKISEQRPNGHFGNSFRSWVLGLMEE